MYAPEVADTRRSERVVRNTAVGGLWDESASAAWEPHNPQGRPPPVSHRCRVQARESRWAALTSWRCRDWTDCKFDAITLGVEGRGGMGAL